MESVVKRFSTPFGGVYHGKKVLVTGHTGFKGAWLSLWLTELGAEVIGYSLPPTTIPSLFEQCRLKDHVDSHIGDIRDFEHLSRVVREAQPEFVFHLAAQPLVRLSYKEPLETFSVNAMGTAHVLEAVRRAESVRVCQIITSDKCYENNGQEHSYQETDPMGGFDPYSASKGVAELIVGSYRRSFFSSFATISSGVSLSSVRAGNVIGGGDWAADRILPDCIRALSKQESILVRNPDTIRPWQHVLDALSGYLLLASQQFLQPNDFSEAWNFGPSDEEGRTVAYVVNRVVDCWGRGGWAVSEKSSDQNFKEAPRLRLDCTKARSRLSWSPVYETDEAISQAVQWYREAKANQQFNALSFSREQIFHFVKMALKKEIAWARQEELAR